MKIEFKGTSEPHSIVDEQIPVGTVFNGSFCGQTNGLFMAIPDGLLDLQDPTKVYTYNGGRVNGYIVRTATLTVS